MQAVHDIFRFWNSTAEFAKAIHERPDTVRKWKKFHRIPEEAWERVIVAAAAKGHAISLGDIMAANRPMLRRGRPKKITASGIAA